MKYEAIVATGEIIVRQMTEDELAQDARDRAKFAEQEKEKQELEAQAAAKRSAALAKLESLGLDEDDLKALGL